MTGLITGGRSPRSGSREQHPLVDRAAAVSRVALRRRREALIFAARPILHTSLAAAAAWLVATDVVGHARPFFAPTAAVITLGASAGRSRRRAVELAVGVAVGIGVADALVMAIGTGAGAIALVVGLAMAVAYVVGGGALLVSQAAVSAVLVATLPATHSWSFARLIDAACGAGAALLIAALIAPVDPVAAMRRALRAVTDALSTSLRSAAAALSAPAAEPAESALLEARACETHLAALHRAVADAGPAILPRRRRTRATLARYAQAAEHSDHAVHNTRVLARGIVRAVSLGDSTPPGLVAATTHLALASDGLADAIEHEELAVALRAEAVTAAREANTVLEQTGNMSALHLVAQVRSTAYDLLRALDVTDGEARAAVRTGAIVD